MRESTLRGKECTRLQFDISKSTILPSILNNTSKILTAYLFESSCWRWRRFGSWTYKKEQTRIDYWIRLRAISNGMWKNMFLLSTNELHLYFLSSSDNCPKYSWVLVEVDAITSRIGLKKTITILGLVIVHLWWPISQTRNNLKPKSKSHLLSGKNKMETRRGRSNGTSRSQNFSKVTLVK